MRIGGSGRLYPLLVRITHHVEELRIQKWFPLEIEDQVSNITVDMVDDVLEKIAFQHDGWAAE